MDESSADQEIRKSYAVVHQPMENVEACTKWNKVLRQAGRRNLGGV